MGPDTENYHSYNCQCAVCRSKMPKPATEEDLKIYQDIADNFWKGREVESLRAEVETLRRERDELQHQLAGMTDSAKHFSNGMEYYRGLIDEAAKSIGIAMYTADDQGVHPDPLRAKLPECVEELVRQRDELLAALEEIGNTACGEASHQYMALAAIAKVKGE